MTLRTVARFRDVPAAELACARLRADDIPAVTIHANHVRLDWLISLALGGVKVQVHADDLERARQALALDRSADLADLPESSLAPADGDVCPRCGSEAVEGSTLSRRSRAASMLVGIPFVLWRRRWSCRDCGNRWPHQRAAG